jgi:hypothetical protein
VSDQLTRPFTDAVAEAEELIRGAEFIRNEADLDEGYAYLAGRIRASLQMAFDHDLERPVLINSTHQFARQGLDNPDALYWSAYLTGDGEYVVRGRRGTTADLSFQIMGGTYSAESAPESLAAFDDRELEIAPDGSFEWRFGPVPGAKTLIVREVYNDWDAEERGTLWIERTDRVGKAATPPTRQRLAKQYEIAGKLLTGSIQTWFAFPQFFQYQEPVNTLSVPKPTPGGLASQMSSIGHYELADDEAMIVTVPICEECRYQAIQVGSDWYASTDYETHQTSLTKAQSAVDPDGVLRYVISAKDPGITNWLETTGHRTGPIMLRWQRLERDLSETDGPIVEVVPFDELPSRLPHYAATQIGPSEYEARIAARQRAVARRMLS